MAATNPSPLLVPNQKSPPDPIADLRADIDSFVDELVDGHKVVVPPAPKFLHDPIWGTNAFPPHEIAIIDSPVLQRLRRIHQTGFSFLTFPSTTQTRFEHSLGATVVSTRMFKEIARRHPSSLDQDAKTGDLATIRVAALLHDCGHGFASHVSEAVYRWHPVIRSVQTLEQFKDLRASELISWAIITSAPFARFIEGVNQACQTSLNPRVIADLVLGIAPDHRAFLAELINGPFDADRIDYIVRDSDYSGIKTAVDLERFFHDIDIDLLPDGRQHLILHSTHSIEQLLWAKVHLFARLYRHHKVSATDGLVQNIVSVVRSTGTKFNNVDFSRVSDFLRVTDTEILAAASDGPVSPELQELLYNLRRRYLPARCLAITPTSIKSGPKTIKKLLQLNEIEGALDRFRDELIQAIPQDERPPISSIVLSFPPITPLREASSVFVRLRGHAEAQTLNSLFRSDEWLTTYTESHWVGHIFAQRDYVDRVTNGAFDVLAEHGIQIDRAMASAIHHPPAITSTPATPRPVEVDSDWDSRQPGLPVLQAYLDEYFEDRRPFQGLNCVLILHFLSDLPPLLQRLEDFGLEPRKTWLVRKPYRYPRAEKVKRELQERKYNIEECTAAEEAGEPARRVLVAMRAAMTADEKFLVIEDGGYVTPMLHTDEFDGLRQHCIGVVEQTTKGIRSIQSIRSLQLPVMAVAQSKLKLALEASEVGDALAFTLESYFRRYQNMPMRVPTLVIGYGAVGRHLAGALRNRGARVSVFDNDYARQAEARSERPGFPTLETLDDLTEFRLIVGTTGTTSLGIDAILRTSSEILLASGSSDRLEFDLGALRGNVAEPLDENISLDGLVTRYRLKNGHLVDVLCDGYPINFIIGDGIAKRVIDPILTELVIGAGLIVERHALENIIHQIPDVIEKGFGIFIES